MSEITRFVTIDEEGYFLFEGTRLEDESVGASLLQHITPQETNRFATQMDGQTAWVEAFDAPFVARHVRREGPMWRLDLPYGYSEPFTLEALSLDEWDRFHGTTVRGIPFVLSRAAQFEFFNLLDDYSDDEIESDGKKYLIPAWLEEKPEANASEFWTHIYQTESPGWEMNAPHPALQSVLPQLKLPRSRVLVLGCGSGNDAAAFAEQGHVVTAVDFSEEALARAKQKYGSLPITWLRADVFKLPESFTHTFDIVFEHTLYCAVNPSRRTELVDVWRRVLNPHGQVLGIFFSMERRVGPPWGGSEWELRKRLQNKFQFLYWTRWRHSSPGRQSKEVVVLARKLP